MIFISWITELIANIPSIISYLIYGYVFLSMYYWISFKDNKDFDNLLIKSIVTSYFLIAIFNLVFSVFGIILRDNEKIILYSILSAFLGFTIGRIITCKWFNDILYKLHIGRTTNENIWDDVIKKNTWLRVFMKDESSYLGQCKYMESFRTEPVVVLVTWQRLDKDGNVIIDNSHNPEELIMLNTKDFEKIEITYQ